MTWARSRLAISLAVLPSLVGAAAAQEAFFTDPSTKLPVARPAGAGAQPDAASSKADTAAKKAVAVRKPANSLAVGATGSVQQPPGQKSPSGTPPATKHRGPLANVTMLHIDLLPLQGDADKCGLDPAALQTSAIYPVAASARLKVGQATLTHMHVRLSSVYVRRLEHCIVHADVRVSSLQPVELGHSKAVVPVYVPLWEKTDIRLSPRGLAQKTAQDRLRAISEQLLVDWSSQN